MIPPPPRNAGGMHRGSTGVVPGDAPLPRAAAPLAPPNPHERGSPSPSDAPFPRPMAQLAPPTPHERAALSPTDAERPRSPGPAAACESPHLGPAASDDGDGCCGRVC